MKTFMNIDKENRDRISAFNEIQFNLMQFNQYIQHCHDIKHVCYAFDEFLNTLIDYETENTENPKDCMADN